MLSLLAGWEQAISIAKGKKPEIDKGEEWMKAEAKALSAKNVKTRLPPYSLNYQVTNHNEQTQRPRKP
jgi:hypothetical protein